jgi:hypothetical protein
MSFAPLKFYHSNKIVSEMQKNRYAWQGFAMQDKSPHPPFAKEGEGVNS